MNGPCAFHPDAYIELAARTVEAHVEGVSVPLRTTRKRAFQRYCNDIAISGSPDVVYKDTQDILAQATECAATILADECPMYAVAEYSGVGGPRIISREVLEQYPKRYTQIIN